MRYKLQILNRPLGEGQTEWILHLPAVVGRSPDSDVPIGDPSISRRHCQFYLNGEGALSVRDFDSMNGTYVNEKRVARSTLTPGCVVRAGAFTMKIEWTDDEMPSKSGSRKTGFGRPGNKITQPVHSVPKDKLK